jgi:hypothetical protein
MACQWVAYITLFFFLLTPTTCYVSDERLLRALVHSSRAAAARHLQPPAGGGGGGPPPPGGGGAGGPPGGGGGGPGGGGLAPGAVAATSCGTAACTTDGGGNYISRSLTLDTSNGIFSGSLTTNGCPNHAGAYQYQGVKDLRVFASAASCQTWTLPVTGYAALPKAAPLRGSIGYTISGGESLYGPMDAGFTLGQVCTTPVGTAPAGTDTRFAGALIERACGTANLKGNTSASMHMLLSDCGGHAGYHVHEGLACEYDQLQQGHSTLVAVLLDGRGVFGQYEATGTLPSDLDACNGHYGPTPATTVGSDRYPATANTYHYHLTMEAPFVAGCFGPATAAQARALYPSCAPGGAACTCPQTSTCTCAAGQVMESVCTSLGSVESYTLDCPILGPRGGLTLPGYINAKDPRCPPCAGNCPAGGATTMEKVRPPAASGVAPPPLPPRPPPPKTPPGGALPP